MLLVLLFLCGPIGTIVTFCLLPMEGSGAEGPDVRHGAAHRQRVVHLSLVGSDRRARFVLDETTPWEAFIAGCEERLDIGGISRITDSSGDEIRTVAVRQLSALQARASAHCCGLLALH